jgi:hypothetical protein
MMIGRGSEKATRGRVRTPKVRRLPDENEQGSPIPATAPSGGVADLQLNRA